MKGQAAMEYLMTYGWAILIVIAVVAALYAMGVFKLPTGGVAKCSPCFPPGSAVAYVDHTADDLVLTVGPHDIKVTAVYNDAGACTCSAGTNVVQAAQSKFTLTCAGCFSGDVSVTIEYEDQESGLTHNVSATLHGA